jgi:quercetin dioxygenase-like cupin family protein
VTLAAGDTLYLLGYRGEGSYVAWVRGQLVWFDDVTDGTVLDPPQSIWWVQLRNARGQIGWTTERDEFANTNSLIRPPEPTSMFVYWMRDRPWTELKPGVHIRPIVGETGTFTVAELDPGAETFVHHHTQEQLNVGLSAGNEISRAGHVHSLGVGVATVTPPDVEHFIRNAGPGKAMLLEYQPIRRFDLLPPRPAPAYASAPQAISMTEKQLLELEIGSASAAWIAEPNGVRTTLMAGQRALLTVMDVPAAVRQPVNLRPQAVSAEQFFYVLAGDVRLSVGADAYRVSAGSAFLVPRRAVAVQLRLISRDARLLRFDVK